jgi:hypothetical protein
MEITVKQRTNGPTNTFKTFSEEKSDKQPTPKRQRVTQITDGEYNYHRNDPQIAFCLDCIK